MNKTLVYILELDGVKAIHFDLDGLKGAIEMEIDNRPEDEIIDYDFKVYFRYMTEKEINELPEFDGF